MDEDSREGTIGTGKRESGPSRRRRESSSSSSSFPVPVASSGKKSSKRSPSSGKSRGNSSSGTHSKVDAKAKLERSRQSARECRARKKLRYQYLEDLVNKREKAVILLHKELESNRELFEQVESGKKSVEALKVILDQPSN